MLCWTFISVFNMVQRWKRISLGSQWRKDQEHSPLQVSIYLIHWRWHDTLLICFSNNQSLIIMDVKSEDSGRFSCVAMSDSEQQIVHTTRFTILWVLKYQIENCWRLTSFPPPVFAHPPIWNNPPEDIKVKKGLQNSFLRGCDDVDLLGAQAELLCSVTVGQQYNSMQPVYAAWLRSNPRYAILIYRTENFVKGLEGN